MATEDNSGKDKFGDKLARGKRADRDALRRSVPHPYITRQRPAGTREGDSQQGTESEDPKQGNSEAKDIDKSGL
jgi:hypothetical protein